MELNVADKSDIQRVFAMHVRNREGVLVPLSAVTTVHNDNWENTIYHKDLLPVVYVTADMAGKLDSPLYGMFDVVGKLGNSLQQFFISQPLSRFDYSMKWDGEWKITYETFRDMGSGAVSFLCSAFGYYGAYCFHAGWNSARTRAARCAIYGNLNDWHDCFGRNYCS
jgi:multidrug efflux pump subunit AcrB